MTIFKPTSLFVFSLLFCLAAGDAALAQIEPASEKKVKRVIAGFGLDGGGTSKEVTLSVDTSEIQTRVTGNCTTGNAIRIVNADGTVACQSVGGGTVTSVTASAPLASSGGTTPDITLPDVIIGFNTAIGRFALQSNVTGHDNTAIGRFALQSNVTGHDNTAVGESALASNNNSDGNTAVGIGALFENATGSNNTAVGDAALSHNTTGFFNTAVGSGALLSNTTGVDNLAIGSLADVSAGDLTNATAIGFGAVVNASNKIRLGNSSVTVIEGQVNFTASSDVTKKENFRPVDGEAVLKKISGFNLTSWNFIGHDPKVFRHYGPMAQDFFAAFGRDEVGQIGTETTINSGDLAGILMVAVQALEKRTAEVAELKARIYALEEMIKARPSVTASVQPR
jgi:endosialidase-like protein